MKKLNLVMIVLLLFSESVFALEDVISLTIDINKNDTVLLRDMSIIQSVRTKELVGDEYKIKTLDKNGNVLTEEKFDIQFILYSNPPKFIDSKTVIVKLPYSKETFKIMLEHKNNTILEKDVVLCKIDGVCSGYENFISCPQDCPSGSRDNYCDKQFDKKCDPDCAKDVDVDCLCGDKKCEVEKGESYNTCPQDCPSGLNDNFCDKIIDGVCDPDCLVNEDGDCKHVFTKDSDKKEDGNLLFILMLFIVSVFLAFFLIRGKSKKKEQDD
jgi:hypothetical protein